MNWLQDKARNFINELSNFPSRLKNGYLQYFDNLKGTWKWVHRRVAEIITGSYIPRGYEVHHINRDKLDNDPDNLQVLSKEEHRAIHRNDYKNRVDTLSKKLNSLKNKIANQENTIPKPDLSMKLNRMITSEKLKVDKLFNEFKLNGSLSSSCGRCGGTGFLQQFKHISGGVCFLCGGNKVVSESSFEDFDPNFGEEYWDDSYDDYEEF